MSFSNCVPFGDSGNNKGFCVRQRVVGDGGTHEVLVDGGKRYPRFEWAESRAQQLNQAFSTKNYKALRA